MSCRIVFGNVAHRRLCALRAGLVWHRRDRTDGTIREQAVATSRFSRVVQPEKCAETEQSTERPQLRSSMALEVQGIPVIQREREASVSVSAIPAEEEHVAHSPGETGETDG